MKIEVGKTYVLNNGEKHVCELGRYSGFAMGVFWYHEDGRCGYQNADHPRSVSHEYTQPEGKPLAELDVKEGDVVECVNEGVFFKEGQRVTVESGVKLIGLPADNFDVSLFRIVSSASDTPTLWRDMTDAEKGALLLADHNGEEMQAHLHDDVWEEKKNGFPYLGHRAYRIKLEPKVETVLWCQEGVECDYTGNTHRITFTTTNGKPDTASIKMEEM